MGSINDSTPDTVPPRRGRDARCNQRRGPSTPPDHPAATWSAARSCPAACACLPSRCRASGRRRSASGWASDPATRRPASTGLHALPRAPAVQGHRASERAHIAEAFDEVGGESNAATAKEHTCYYARVLDEDLPMAIDVIADMVTSAVIDPEELEQERGVILEEIAMDNDDPEDVALEEFAEGVLGSHPLGRPSAGRRRHPRGPRESVRALPPPLPPGRPRGHGRRRSRPRRRSPWSRGPRARRLGPGRPAAPPAARRAPRGRCERGLGESLPGAPSSRPTCWSAARLWPGTTAGLR